jgi:hypothetical protein
VEKEKKGEPIKGRKNIKTIKLYEIKSKIFGQPDEYFNI